MTKAKVCGSVFLRGSNTLPGTFRWSDGPVRILGVWFGPDLQLERNWSEVQAMVNAQVAFKEVVLKGQGGGVRRVRLPLDPLPIGCTFLCLRHIGWRFNDPSPDCSGEVQSR